MIYVFENDNNDASIVYDGMILTEEERTKGIAIEQLPAREEIEGKIAVLKCNKSTNEVWYEYIDKPISLEEQQEVVTVLGQELALLKIQLIQGGVI